MKMQVTVTIESDDPEDQQSMFDAYGELLSWCDTLANSYGVQVNVEEFDPKNILPG